MNGFMKGEGQRKMPVLPRDPGNKRSVLVRMKAAASALLLFFSFLSFAATPGENSGAAASSSRAESGGVIRLGIQAFRERGAYSSRLSENSFAMDALPQLLRKKLPGYRIEVRTLRATDLVKEARAGQFDFVFGSSGVFAQLQPDGAYPLANVVSPRAPDPNNAEGGAVIVRSDRDDLGKVSDLRGRTAVGGRKSMYFSYQIPASALSDRGFDPENFFSTFTETDFPVETVLTAVREGRADAGFVRACVLEELPESVAARFRVLEPVSGSPLKCAHTSRLFPSWTFGATRSAPPEAAKQAAVALLSAPPSDPAGIRWGIANQFSKIDDLYRKLRIGRYEYLRHWTLARFWSVAWPFALAGLAALLVLLYHFARVKALVKVRTQELEEEIEARKALEKKNAEVSEAFRRAERTSAAGQISNMVAHEIRQPLAALHARLHTAGMVVKREGYTAPMLERSLIGAGNETNRISAIVDHICAYCREGRKTEPVNLADVARSVVADAPGMHLAEFRPALDIRSPGRVLGDPLELKLVIWNLVRNAAEAAEGRDPGIVLRVWEEGGKAFLMCEDHASRLTEERAREIGNGAASTKATGLGLGLAIVRAIVETHAGSIRFETNGGEGLRVTVAFPAREERK